MPMKLEDIKTKVDAEMYVEELRGFHTPSLDAYRKEILAMKTSDLIITMANPDQLPSGLSEVDAKDMIGMFVEMTSISRARQAALIAITDEIDRRIPIPA